MSVGTIYLKIRVRLEADIDESQVDDFVENLDYSITGSPYVDGPNLVADTEIMESDLSY